MKKILQKIANILTLNVHNINSVGLLNGQMGIVLFYYNYSRFTQNKLYSDIADELFESVYNKVAGLKDISFDQGILGIAWGIRYLIRNKFVEGNPDEVLSEIEDFLFKQNISDNAQSPISLSAMGMYIHSMIKDGVELDKIDQLICMLLNKYEFYFLSLPDRIRPMTYVNSVLWVLSEFRKYGKYKVKADKIIFKVLLYLSQLDTFNQMDSNDLRTLRKILLSLDLSIPEKEEVLTYLSISKAFKNIDEMVRYLWQNVVFFPNEIISLERNEWNKFIDDNYLYLPRENTLSIYNGLAGIGLNLINVQKNNKVRIE